MVELELAVLGAGVDERSVAPAIAVELRVRNRRADEILVAGVLRCQVRIRAAQRPYSSAEQARLRELFGDPPTPRRPPADLVWTQTAVCTPEFRGETTVSVSLPCSSDFNLAVAKYFYALREGEVPIALLFSGSMFRRTERGVEILPVPWSLECAYALPVAAWQQVLERHYPDRAVVTLSRAVFERLYQHRVATGAATWDRTIEGLLP